MASKADRFYFENLVASADCACSAANYLYECLSDYHLANIKSSLAKMHEIEHLGDTKKHEMSGALAKAFVTPVDREDLALISHNIDDVTDLIEEVLQRFYVNQIEAVHPEALRFVEKLVSCCEMMKNTLVEFSNFKKPAKLHEMIIALGRAEEECDGIYLDALLAVRTKSTDVLQLIFWREIYECMENCADACEHVGDSIDTVVMKNT